MVHSWPTGIAMALAQLSLPGCAITVVAIMVSNQINNVLKEAIDVVDLNKMKDQRQISELRLKRASPIWVRLKM